MSITLVSSDKGYKHEFTRYLEDPEDHSEIRKIKQKFTEVADSLGISDYKILPEPGLVNLRLRTIEDFHKVVRELNPQPVEEAFAYFDKEYDFRKIKNASHEWQRVVNKSELLGSVQIEADRKAKALVVKATDTLSYQQFCAMIDGTAQFTPMS